MPYIETNLENIITIKKNVIFSYLHDREGFFEFGTESHDFWEFEYISTGTYQIVHDDKKIHTIKAGDIIFHKPNQPHLTIGIPPYDSVNGVNISFVCNSAAMKCFEDYHGHLSPKSVAILNDLIEEGKQNFYNIIDGPIAKSALLDDAPLGGQQAYRLKLELFLINMIREIHQENPGSLFTSKSEFYRDLHTKVTEYLHSNIYSNISLEEMCKKFNYSKAFLCKKFKEETGESIISYYNTLKIKEAQTLLKEKEHSVSYVAEILGFASRYYFSKAFKKLTGISPSEYKKIYNSQ